MTYSSRCRDGALCGQRPPVSHRIHGYVPNLPRSVQSVGAPSVGPVELLRAGVACDDPQYRPREAQPAKVATRPRCERPSDSAAPAIGLDIERTELSLVDCVPIACRGYRGEAEDRIRFDGDEG